MDNILEFYNEYHFLVLLFVIIFFIIYIKRINKKGNISLSQNEISKKIYTDADKVTINDKTNKESIKFINKKNEFEIEINGLTKPREFRYQSTRLSFRKNIIEQMLNNDILIIEVVGAQNPDNNGVFKLTLDDIYKTFPNVIKSDAYLIGGNYNYKQNPMKVNQFRV